MILNASAKAMCGVINWRFDVRDVIIFCLAAFSILMLSVALKLGEHIAKFEKAAIEQGYAEYNSTTGDWQWKSKEDVCGGEK